MTILQHCVGDDPVLLDRVTLKFIGESVPNPLPKIVHYEFWDVNRHQLMTEWVRYDSHSKTYKRTGEAGPPGDYLRDRLNDQFIQQVNFDSKRNLLISSMKHINNSNIPSPDFISGNSLSI